MQSQLIDAEGYIIDQLLWKELLVEEFADGNKIQLTEAHWDEMEKRDRKVEAPASENMHPNRATQDGWQGASILAYRSAYLKLHFDDL